MFSPLPIIHVCSKIKYYKIEINIYKMDSFTDIDRIISGGQLEYHGNFNSIISIYNFFEKGILIIYIIILLLLFYYYKLKKY